MLRQGCAAAVCRRNDHLHAQPGRPKGFRRLPICWDVWRRAGDVDVASASYECARRRRPVNRYRPEHGGYDEHRPRICTGTAAEIAPASLIMGMLPGEWKLAKPAESRLAGKTAGPTY